MYCCFIVIKHANQIIVLLMADGESCDYKIRKVTEEQQTPRNTNLNNIPVFKYLWIKQ